MKDSGHPQGSGVTCLSVSAIPDGSPAHKTKEPVSTAEKKNCEGPSNTDDALEYAINSRQYLCADGVKPRMIIQVFGAIVVALTQLGDGAMFSFPGITLPQLTQPDSDDIYLSPNNAALFGSLATIGAAIGSVISGIILVRFGQRSVLLVTLPISLCTWLLQALSPTILLLLVSRFVIGLVTGLICTASNTFVMELSHKDYRGLLFAIVPTARQLGHFFVAGIGNSSLHWRQMSLVCGFVTTLPSFLGLFFLPNSPRWLVTRGRVNDAVKSLAFFRGRKYDITTEIKDIVNQVNEQQSTKSNFFTQLRLLGRKATLPKFLTALFITVWVSFNGSFVITTYLVPIFQASSSGVDAYTSAMYVGAVRVAGTLVSMVIIDRLGRKLLLVITYLVNAVSLAALGVYFYAESQGWNIESYGWVPLTSLVCFTFFVSIAVPVTALLRGELLPTPVRAAGHSVLITTMFTGGFVVIQLYSQTTEAVGEHGAFWIYGGACAVVSVFSFFMLPETSGRSLEEITGEPKCITSGCKDVASQETTA